jgi:hypothetical protein
MFQKFLGALRFFEEWRVNPRSRVLLHAASMFQHALVLYNEISARVNSTGSALIHFTSLPTPQGSSKLRTSSYFFGCECRLVYSRRGD